jgi:hypothetical protein
LSEKEDYTRTCVGLGSWEHTLSTATSRGRHIYEALKRSVVDGYSRPRVKEKVSAEEVDVSKVAV